MIITYLDGLVSPESKWELGILGIFQIRLHGLEIELSHGIQFLHNGVIPPSSLSFEMILGSDQTGQENGRESPGEENLLDVFAILDIFDLEFNPKLKIVRGV